jgi:dGTPase
MMKFNTGSLEHLKGQLHQSEMEALSSQATLNEHGVRRIAEEELSKGYRQNFSVDVDRILHSHAYARYIDKTQVFYLIKNDHITHRVLHVQLVSKIARTIGRFLRLNEDLIEAIALGHDIGHTPFGHDGERVLSAICLDHGIGYFHHNVQSVHFLENVERKGKGWNLCLQTLDGILCHDGEVHNQMLKPSPEKSFATLDREVNLKTKNPETGLVPMSMEGCVVRFADTISYIGRDVEDAIRLDLIKRSDLPPESVDILGNTNGTIVYNLVTDVIQNSHAKSYIAFSSEVAEALKHLKKFNLERIYLNLKIKTHLSTIKQLFEVLFVRFLADVEQENHSSVIFHQFLRGMSQKYITSHRHAEIVRDFIAGMTDQYFLSRCPAELKPEFQRM